MYWLSGTQSKLEAIKVSDFLKLIRTFSETCAVYTRFDFYIYLYPIAVSFLGAINVILHSRQRTVQ